MRLSADQTGASDLPGVVDGAGRREDPARDGDNQRIEIDHSVGAVINERVRRQVRDQPSRRGTDNLSKVVDAVCGAGWPVTCPAEGPKVVHCAVVKERMPIITRG